MSDEQRRALERGAARGEAEARVRALAARVRAGELPRERVELAAWCGDEVARAVAPVGEIPDSIFEWLVGVERFGREAQIRVLAAVAHERVVERSAAARVLASVDAWLDCPCDPHARAVGRALDATPLFHTTVPTRAAALAVLRPGPWVKALEHVDADARMLRADLLERIASWAFAPRPVDAKLAAKAAALPDESLASFGGTEFQVLRGCGITPLGYGPLDEVLAFDDVLGRAVTVQHHTTWSALDAGWNDYLATSDPTRVVHANVRRVLRHGAAPDGRTVFLAHEVVHGEPLAAWLSGDHSLPARCGLARGVALGVGACHSAGLVLACLSPDVILVRAGSPLILELGFARWVAAHANDPEDVDPPRSYLGSPPEVLRGERATPASDVFAVAAVAHHVIAGEPPFPGAGIDQLRAIIQEEARALPASVPPSLVHVLRRGLAKKPEERPPLAELLRTLEELTP